MGITVMWSFVVIRSFKCIKSFPKLVAVALFLLAKVVFFLKNTCQNL